MLKKMSLIVIMFFCTFAFTAFKVSAFIPGYISGIISDASTKEPIGTALIKTDAGRSAISDVNGAYVVTHEEGTFTLTVEAEGYTAYSDTVEVKGLETTVKNIAMSPVQKPSLSVKKTGNGTVTDNTSGINCGTDCDERYDEGKLIILTATPDTGWIFGGWSGDCTGIGECKITVDNDKEVSAVFLKEADIADAYEADNTFYQAHIIEASQYHNFHKPGDEDWMRFYGVSDRTYIISTTDSEAKCDIVIELYDNDGTRLRRLENNNRYGEDETMEWKCSRDGTYYVRTRNYDSEIFGKETGYIFCCPDCQRIKGDIDIDGTADIKDAILALKILLGVPTDTSDVTGADINGDKKIGLAEAVFILKMISESNK